MSKKKSIDDDIVNETAFELGQVGLTVDDIAIRLGRTLNESEINDVNRGRIDSLIAVKKAIVYYATLIDEKPFSAANYKIALEILEHNEDITNFTDDLIEI